MTRPGKGWNDVVREVLPKQTDAALDAVLVEKALRQSIACHDGHEDRCRLESVLQNEEPQHTGTYNPSFVLLQRSLEPLLNRMDPSKSIGKRMKRKQAGKQANKQTNEW